MDIPTRTDWLSVLLQNSDSLFPTGAYAHSGGLEEIVRLGVVSNGATLRKFLRDQVIPLLEQVELPYLRFAYEEASRDDLDALYLLSDEISAWKLGRESRESSTQMGRGRLQVARKVFPHPFLERLANSSVTQHQIIVYGAQMAVNEVPLDSALYGYFYQALAGACSASLKLIRIGQDGVQRVLRDALREAKDVIALSKQIAREEAGWFSPMLEIAVMRHERADERLFIS